MMTLIRRIDLKSVKTSTIEEERNFTWQVEDKAWYWMHTGRMVKTEETISNTHYQAVPTMKRFR